MRHRSAALVLCLLAAPAHADEAMLSSVYWPKGVALRLAPVRARGAAVKTEMRTDMSKGETLLRDTGRAGGKTAAAKSAGSSAAAAVTDPAAARQLKESARVMDREMGEVAKSVIELSTSADDLVRLVLSKSKKELLRPLLLFLVERGVLKATEVEFWLEADDIQPLLDRVRLAVEQLEDRKDALELRRYVLEKNLR